MPEDASKSAKRGFSTGIREIGNSHALLNVASDVFSNGSNHTYNTVR
jgi:hypothetical protein